MTQWIKCSDLLPKNFESVIAYRKGVGVGNMYRDDDIWRLDGWGAGNRTFDDVTHWMPLPPPPEDEA